MGDEGVVDEQLVAVLNEVLDAVYQAKQVSWAASGSPTRSALQEVMGFLIDQSGRFMVAEERIDGVSDAVLSPSSHQRGNVLAEVHGDVGAAVSLLAQRLESIVSDARSRATVIADSDAAQLLNALADGLEDRVHRLLLALSGPDMRS
jgi:hypothetical protein